jgi:fido (protein-threonine AMPylation protein)
VPVAWDDDEPSDAAAIESNCVALLRQLATEAHRRDPPTNAMAQDWHRRVYQGVSLPVPYYAGEFRDSDPEFPELDGYEVAVGPFRAVPATLVPRELANFEASAQAAVDRLDRVIRPGGRPDTALQLQGFVTLCALLHGEWVRIHPFANGNGRTARLWAAWTALRYELPPFVTIKPRPPGNLYELAAISSMQGDHRTAAAAFRQMLDQTLRGIGIS